MEEEEENHMEEDENQMEEEEEEDASMSWDHETFYYREDDSEEDAETWLHRTKEVWRRERQEENLANQTLRRFERIILLLIAQNALF
jgi:hypothetical protein